MPSHRNSIPSDRAAMIAVEEPEAAGNQQRRLANSFEPISPRGSGRENVVCVTV